MSKKAHQVTLVGVRGSKLPVSDCILVNVDAENFTVQAAEKTGRGRGVRLVMRTYVLPKALVQYYFSDEEVVGDLAEGTPVAAAPVKTRAKKAAPAADATADAPKKRRGRPKVVKDAVEAPVADAAPKKRAGRPPKKAAPPAAAAAVDADAPKKRRGRPKGVKNGVPTAPAAAAAATDDAPKKRRGRPKGSKNGVPAAPVEAEAGTVAAPILKKKAGRPKKAPAAEGAAPPKAKKASAAASLFDETF